MKRILTMAALLAVLFCSCQSTGGQPFYPDFFVFQDAFMDTKDLNEPQIAQLVKGLGYDGMELMNPNAVYTFLPHLKNSELNVYAIYLKVDLDADNPYDQRFDEILNLINGGITTIWIHIHSSKHENSAESGDARCIEIIRDMADKASTHHVRLALYPHTNFWLEKLGDAVRLTKKIDRENVGAVFNLCHYLKADDKDQLVPNLEAAIPYLSLVSINGADDGDTHKMGWDRLIQPLGEGTFDVLPILQVLKDNGYKGNIGLQCYNIKQRPEVHLATSMAAWKAYLKVLNP